MCVSLYFFFFPGQHGALGHGQLENVARSQLKAASDQYTILVLI